VGTVRRRAAAEGSRPARLGIGRLTRFIDRFEELARGLLLAAFVLCPGAARAQADPWPQRPVRLIVPSTPGSGIDLMARSLAEHLAARWGKPVVLENRPGANSIIGTEAAARSAPDGHVLLFSSDAAFTINPHVYPKLPYDPLADFAPVAQVVTFSQILVAHASAGVASWPGLVAAAERSPGRLAYASPGTGSTAHLASELLARRAAIELLHVPYKGFAPAFQAVLNGEVPLGWSGIFAARSHVEAGRLRALGIAAAKRSRFMPAVPTFAELGVEGMAFEQWFGVFAPAATPPALVERLHHDIAQWMTDPAVQERDFLARAYEPSGLGPGQFGVLLRRELAARGPPARALRAPD
jgi:tripartite-type tricarboxylate transporter receptor subunit TctC